MDLVGKTLDRYRIVERIGQGGMATIFKAHQPALDRFVAIKVLPAQHALTPGFSERFLREARAVAHLNHPNILPVFDFGQEGDLSYIVMKLVTCGTLKDRLSQPLDPTQAAGIIEQIAAALDHAHGRGVLHRDVKPSNVLLDEGDWVQLADFGLAKVVAGDAQLTGSGVSVGTPTYMSPEQGQGLEVDHRTDIYSLGVILYEIVTGRVPYSAETPMAVVFKHIFEPLPPPSEVNPGVPAAVEAVIVKGLAKKPEDRHASAGEMARALWQAVTLQASAMPAPSTSTPLRKARATGAAATKKASTWEHRIQLHQILDDRFDEKELRTLCFALEMKYEDLPGEGQGNKARELLAYLERRGRIPELIKISKRLRPDIPWDALSPQPIFDLGAAEERLATYTPRLELTLPPEPAHPPRVVNFVGREAELAYYAGKLATRHPAIITGMAGVGKTALAVTLAQQVTDPDHTFWHAFHEGEGVDALLWKLAGFLAWHEQEDLWHLLQGTQQSGGQPPPIEVLLDYLFQMVCRKGYLLCLDDWHFVEDDPLLAQLVERLCRAVEAGELSLIITSRRVPEFAMTVEVDGLAGLSSDDTQALLDVRGMALPANLAADLSTYTEGNAELLTLAIGALGRTRDRASLVAHLEDTDDIERFLMGEVDAGLAEDERAVMSTVAVLRGYPGTRDAIETILDSGSVRRILSDLVRRHLLSAGLGEWGREYGQHAMVRAFYYDMLGRRERQTMHHRAGAYYESEEPDVLKAARHFERAREYERAARLVTADVWAIINQGQAQGLRLLLKRFKAQQLDAQLWAAVNITRGQVHTVLGERQTARQSYQEALSELDPLPDASQVRELRARACIGLGDALQYVSPQQALDWLRRGLDAVTGQNTPEEATLYIKIGDVHIATGDYPAALSALQKGLDLLPENTHQLRAAALINLGTVYSSQGDIERGNAYTLRGLEISKQLHDHFQMLLAWSNLGLDKEIAGDWEGAAADYQRALSIAERIGSITEQARIENLLGVLYANQGDHERALDLLLHSLELARSHGLKEDLICVLCNLANLQIRLREWQVAQASLSEAEQLAVEMGAKYLLPEIYYRWAQVHLAKEQPETALDYAQRSVSLARELEVSLEEGKGLRILGEVLLTSGQHEPAMAAFEQSLSLLADRAPYQAARTKAQWGAALVSDESQKKSLLQEARAVFQSLGAHYDLATVDKALRSDD